MTKEPTVSAVVAALPGTVWASEAPYPWIPDQGDGTYRNPVLYADYSDPDVVRVGDDFYMTASSFNCTPALPILHSHDLVNWTLVHHAVKNLPDERYKQVQPGCGVWAPAIRYHEGRFWIFFPMPDEGIYVTAATDPAGEWTEPHCVVTGKGLIDPCPLWDDDGQAYLVHAYARSRSGIKHRLRICPMAPDGSRLLGEGVIIADGEELYPTIEGPKFLKRDGWYYVLAPAGGVETGWQLVLRSRHIYGPYEDRRVLEQGVTPINGPHQGALVDTPEGEWWFLHFQDDGVYGRIVHLQPVTWREGWPEMGVDQDHNGIGEPVESYLMPRRIDGVQPQAPETSDDFDSPRLGLQWQWYANHDDSWYSLTARPNWLRLFSQPAPREQSAEAGGLFLHMPHLLLQKFPARSFVAETALEFSPLSVGEQTGLAIVGIQNAALVLERMTYGCRLVLRVNGEPVAETPFSGDGIRLRVTVRKGGECWFSWSPRLVGGDWISIGEAFIASEGHWIGAKVGIFATAAADSEPGKTGHADFHYFHFRPPLAS